MISQRVLRAMEQDHSESLNRCMAAAKKEGFVCLLLVRVLKYACIRVRAHACVHGNAHPCPPKQRP